MRESSKGKSVVFGALAAFIASAPTGTQASSNEASLTSSRQETRASPAAIKILESKAMKADLRTAQFVQESGPSWVRSGQVKMPRTKQKQQK
jgi:hypothetical protein